MAINFSIPDPYSGNADNPFVSGMTSASGLLNAIAMRKKVAEEAEQFRLQNAYLPQEKEQDIAKKNVELEYLPREKDANIQNVLAQSGLYGSQAKYYNAEALNAPLVAQAALIKANAALNKEWVKADIKNLQSARTGAENAQTELKNLDNFLSVYPKINPLQKGAMWGWTPAVSSAAQEADRYANAMGVGEARDVGGGRPSVYALKLALTGLKLNRGMNAETVRNAGFAKKAALVRKQEYYPFVSQALSKGLSSAQADALWRAYDIQYPEFNEDTHKAHFSNNYHKFLEDDVIRQMLTTGSVPTLLTPDEYKKLSKSQRQELQDMHLTGEISG